MNPINKLKRKIYLSIPQDTDDVWGYLTSSTTRSQLKRKILGGKKSDKASQSLSKLCDELGCVVPSKLKDVKYKRLRFTAKTVNKGDAIIIPDKRFFPVDYQVRRTAEVGAVAILVEKSQLEEIDLTKEELDSYPLVTVTGLREKMIAWCAAKRNTYNGKVVAITGSVGKTTTKQFCNLVASQKKSTFFNIANENSWFNVANNIAEDMKSNSEVYIQEVGASKVGSVKMMAEMLEPDIAIVTNIKEHHLKEYKTVENILKDKIQIVEKLHSNGVAIVNMDDHMLASYDYKCNTVKIGIKSEDVDYRAINIEQKDAWLHFDVEHNGRIQHIKANVVGEVNAYNILEAYAMGKILGIKDGQIAEAIAKYETQGNRQNVKQVGNNTLYVDCYNVSNDTIVEAMRTLEGIEVSEGARRIAVVGGENKLGDLREEKTIELGKLLAMSHVDEIVCYGNEEDDEISLNKYGDAKLLYETIKSEGFENVRLIRKFDEIVKYIETEIQEGDAILFKCITYLNMCAAIDKVFGTDYCVGQRLIKNAAERHSYKGFSGYKILDMDEIYIDKVSEKILNSKHVVIPDEIDGYPVFGLARGLFAYSNVETLDCGNNLKHIGTGAFAGCTKLKEITGKKGVKIAKKGAFRGCVKLKDTTDSVNYK